MAAALLTKMLVFIIVATFNMVLGSTLTQIATLSGTPGSYPHTFDVDANEAYVYVTDATGTLSQIDMTTNSISIIYSSSAGNCYSVNVDTANNVLYNGGYNILNAYNSITTGGSSSVTFNSASGSGGTYSTASTIFWPHSSVTDRTNNIVYIADAAASVESASSGAIWRMNFPPQSNSDFISLSLTLNSVAYVPGAPHGLALNLAKTNLYFVESVGNKVSVVDLSTLAVTNLVTTGIARPMGIAVDSTETYAYVSTWTTPTDAIIKIDLSTYSVTTFYSASASINSLYMDSTNSFLWFTDTNSFNTLSLASGNNNNNDDDDDGSSGANSSGNSSEGDGNNTNNLGAIAAIGALPLGYLMYFLSRRRLSMENKTEVKASEVQVETEMVNQNESVATA